MIRQRNGGDGGGGVVEGGGVRELTGEEWRKNTSFTSTVLC